MVIGLNLHSLYTYFKHFPREESPPFSTHRSNLPGVLRDAKSKHRK